MIKANPHHDGLWFVLDDGSAQIDVLDGMVNIRISNHGDVAQIDADDAVSLLRAMLREIAGPSIDDVREAWDDPFLTVSWLEGYCVVVDFNGYAVGGSDDHETEREALQAAYDAGIAQKGERTRHGDM